MISNLNGKATKSCGSCPEGGLQTDRDQATVVACPNKNNKQEMEKYERTQKVIQPKHPGGSGGYGNAALLRS